MGESDRIRYGQVYSPDAIVAYILDKTLVPALTVNPVEAIKVFEPACGDGRFLTAVCERLTQEYLRLGQPGTVAIRNILARQLFGMDISAQAVEQARARLKHQTGGIPEHIICGDTLNKTVSYPEVPLTPDYYDVIVGNPPYVTWQITAPIRAFYREHYCTAGKGRMNLYRLFIERCLELLKPEGYLGFICPNTYLTDRDSRLVRKMLLEKTHIQEIACLPESAAVFSGVTQATTILVVQKKEKISVNHRVRVKTLTAALQFPQDEGYLPQRYWQEKTGGKFQLHPVWDEALFEKIYRGRSLGNIAEIYQGEVNLTLCKQDLRDVPGQDNYPLIRGCHVIPFGFRPEQQRNKFSYIQPSRMMRGHATAKRLVFQQVSNAAQSLRLKCGLLTPPQPVYCANSTNYVLLPDQDLSMYYFLMALGHSTVWNLLYNIGSSTNHITVRELGVLPVPECPPALRRRLVSLVKKAAASPGEPDAEIVRRIDEIIYRLFSLQESEREMFEKYRRQSGKGLP
mgnify:CR=1 FL=1